MPNISRYNSIYFLSKFNKRRHIEFYKEVKDELQNQLSTEKYILMTQKIKGRRSLKQSIRINRYKYVSLCKVYILLYFKIILVYVCFFKPYSSQKKRQPSAFVQFCNTIQYTTGEPNNYSSPLLLFYFCGDHHAFHKLCNPQYCKFFSFSHKHKISFFW